MSGLRALAGVATAAGLAVVVSVAWTVGHTVHVAKNHRPVSVIRSDGTP